MREEGHLRSHKVAASTPKQSDDVLYTDIPCSSNGRTVSLKNTDRLQVPIAQCGSVVKLRPIHLDNARRSSTLSLVQHPTWKLSSVSLILDEWFTARFTILQIAFIPWIWSSIRGGSVGSGSLCPIGHVSPALHNIISSGLGVAQRQKDIAKTQVFPRKSNKWTRDQKNNVSLLTPCRDKGAWKGWVSYRRSCVTMPVNDRDCPRISLRERRSLLQWRWNNHSLANKDCHCPACQLSHTTGCVGNSILGVMTPDVRGADSCADPSTRKEEWGVSSISTWKPGALWITYASTSALQPSFGAWNQSNLLLGSHDGIMEYD